MEERPMTATETTTPETTSRMGRYVTVGGLSLLAAGGYFLWRRKGRPGHMRKTMRINRPPQEVYEFWRNLENLPRFIPHLESVTRLSENRSRWVARGAAGATVEWEAETLVDTPEKISWKSVEGSQVNTTGTVEFRPSGGGNATDLRVTLTFAPPVGGAIAAKMAYPYVSSQLENDLQNLKQMLEGGGTGQATAMH